MNIECGAETLTELEHAFKFNDAVLRHLIVAKNEAVVTPSPMMKDEKSKSLTGRDAERTERPPAETPRLPHPQSRRRQPLPKSATEVPTEAQRGKRAACRTPTIIG
jgi:hypothetical protein